MPAKQRSLDDVLRIAEDVLRTNRVEHVFVGGVTVLAFGIPRTTTDVDVIAVIEARQIPKIVAGFQRFGFFASGQDLHDALVEGGHVTIHDTRSTYRIDLVPASTAAHRETLKGKRRIVWRHRRLPLAAPEQTDALGIYVRQKKKLNFRAMRDFARRHGVTRELNDLEQRARNLS